MQDQAAHDANLPYLLRDILAVVAENAELHAAASRLLALAVDAVGAVGGRVVLFVEPRLSVSVGAAQRWTVTDEQIVDALANLLPGMEPEPVAFGRNGRRALTALLAPVATDGIVGGLVLLFRGHAPPAAAGVMTDITNALRICTERARRDRQRAQLPRFEQAIRLFPDPVLLLDDAQTVLSMNLAAENAFGIAQAQAEGRSLADVPGLKPLARHLSSAKLPDEWTRDGSEKVYAPRKVRLDDDEGVDLLVLADISRFKKLDANHETFLQIAAHDLRAPLTSALLNLRLLDSILPDTDPATILAIIGKAEQSLLGLNDHIDNILDAGQYDAETGFYRVHRQAVDMREIVARISEYRLIGSGKTLALSFHVDDDVPVLNVDPMMIERAATNLVDNAIKYTPDGGTVNLHVWRDAEQVVVSVHDTGLGISHADQKRLFQRHVRLRRREHHRIKGTGLGLFIVRSVALRHGGEAWVESRENEGSTFCFSIPLNSENTLVPQP